MGDEKVQQKVVKSGNGNSAGHFLRLRYRLAGQLCRATGSCKMDHRQGTHATDGRGNESVRHLCVAEAAADQIRLNWRCGKTKQ